MSQLHTLLEINASALAQGDRLFDNHSGNTHQVDAGLRQVALSRWALPGQADPEEIAEPWVLEQKLVTEVDQPPDHTRDAWLFDSTDLRPRARRQLGRIVRIGAPETAPERNIAARYESLAVALDDPESSVRGIATLVLGPAAMQNLFARLDPEGNRDYTQRTGADTVSRHFLPDLHQALSFRSSGKGVTIEYGDGNQLQVSSRLSVDPSGVLTPENHISVTTVERNRPGGLYRASITTIGLDDTNAQSIPHHLMSRDGTGVVLSADKTERRDHIAIIQPEAAGRIAEVISRAQPFLDRATDLKRKRP